MLKGLAVTAALLLAGGTAASADPVAPPARIILASGGCGFAFHRDVVGECVPNRRIYGYGPGRVVGRLPPPCPRGYHRDPDPARPICYPNF